MRAWRLCVKISAALMVLGICGTALAHGGNPIPRKFYQDPLNQDVQVVVSSDQGLHLSEDGGDTWYWICEDIIGFDVLDFALAGPVTDNPADRVWLAGGLGLAEGERAGEFVPGLYRSTDGGCNWQPTQGAMTDQWASAISVNPQAPDEVVVTTTHLNLPNGIAFSEDAGLNWSWTNVEGLEDTSFTTLLRATSDPQRLYASSDRYLLRSTDGGRTWENIVEDLSEDPSDEMRVHAIDYEDAQTFYFSILTVLGRHLYVSEDGGNTYRKILEPPSREFEALVILPAEEPGQRRLVVGDTFGTGLRSEDGGETWQEYLAGVPSIECLASVQGQQEDLFVCSNPSVQLFPPIITIGRSSDDGRTVDPYFAYSDTDDYRICGADSQVQTVCATLMDINNSPNNSPSICVPPCEDGFECFNGFCRPTDTPDAGMDAADEDAADQDSGQTTTTPKNKGGCDCSVGSPQGASAPWWVMLALTACLLRRRKQTLHTKER